MEYIEITTEITQDDIEDLLSKHPELENDEVAFEQAVTELEAEKIATIIETLETKLSSYSPIVLLVEPASSVPKVYEVRDVEEFLSQLTEGDLQYILTLRTVTDSSRFEIIFGHNRYVFSCTTLSIIE